MSKKPQSESSELVNAATAIEEELRRFESLAEEVRSGPLRSQKHLEKMGKLLNAVADCDERMVANMRALLSVLNGWRDRQQALAAEVNNRALELQERTKVYQSLMERFSALGQEAGSLSTHMQQIAGRTQQGEPVKAEDIIASLQMMNDRMSEVAANAGALASDAEAQDFMDVARDADSLKQQLLSARNRANLLQQKLHSANA